MNETITKQGRAIDQANVAKVEGQRGQAPITPSVIAQMVLLRNTTSLSKIEIAKVLNVGMRSVYKYLNGK